MMSTTDATLGNGIEANEYHSRTGSVNLNTLADTVERIHRTLAEHPDIGGDVPMDAHWLTDGEHQFLTPGGEVVWMATQSPSDGGEGEVMLIYPERDALDEDGEPVPYSHVTDVETFMDRMDADGGWTLITRFAKVGTPQCPRCNRFMSMGEDHNGWPFGQCTCGCDVGVDELMEQDAVVEVF